MDTNGILQKHWLGVLIAFLTDALLLVLGLLIAIQLRLGVDWIFYIMDYVPSILLGALVLSCACYTAGLYSLQGTTHSLFNRTFLVGFCLAVTVGVMLASFYVNYSGRIGRGILVPGMGMAFGFIVLHHAFLLHRARSYRERIAVLLTSRADEAECGMLKVLGGEKLEVAGVITAEGYSPAGSLAVLGEIGDIGTIAARHKLDRVLCTNHGLTNPALYCRFSLLRYSGVPVMPLIGLCEELYHCAPVDLVTPEWLLNASGSPHVFYIRKLKRGFDIAASLVGLVVLGPIALLGAAAVKFTSRGPVLYRQTRSGRFGKTFQVIKLRTMRVDAEKDGVRWAAANDSRVTWTGRFLRKFRVDEIPQLVNVLRGEMSFVGPRPERPEFVAELATQIPYYEERLMVQPGITGWAQVNYPYGASVEDTRRKLEYDLYYMKNMSLFLDMFILLDTVRIILRGGMDPRKVRHLPEFATRRELETSTELPALPVAASKSAGS